MHKLVAADIDWIEQGLTSNQTH